MVGVLALSIQRWPSVRPTSGNVGPLALTQFWVNVHLTHFHSNADVSWEHNTVYIIKGNMWKYTSLFFFTVKTNLKLYLKGTENKTNKFCKIKLCCIIALKCRIQEADPEIISHSLTKQLEQIKVFTAWCWPVSIVIVIFDMLGWPIMLLLCMSSGSLLTVSIKNEDFLFISSFFTLHIEKLKLFILRIQ